MKSLFLVTAKRRYTNGSFTLVEGMSAEVLSSHSNPLSTNGGIEVNDAFLRKYNLDLKKNGALSMTNFDVKKIG